MTQKLAKSYRKISEILRVNHAGEYAAKRIYQGQLDFIRDNRAKSIIQEMADGEVEHLKYFENEIVRRQARPTLLYPLVHSVGYALGAVTAKMGVRAAMACTSAVEEVIADHYQEQINDLDESERALKKKIIKFRQDEIGHKEEAEKNEAEKARGHSALSAVIKNGCKLAIALAKKI